MAQRATLRRLLAITLASALALGALACSSSSSGSGDATTTSTAATPSEDPWDATIDDAIADLEDYWAVALPEVTGQAYQPVSGGFHPYSPGSPIPPCGSPPPSYDQIAGNAFYCRTDDLVAWDEQAFVADLFERFGSFTIALIMAHEWGHVIQARLGVEGPTIFLEQQADCFAGAWAASVANGYSTRFETGLAELDAALGGFLTLRDNPGTAATAADAHGSGFDRVAAFQDGFLDGARTCVGYVDDPPTVVALPFESAADAATGGNLPYDEVAPLAVADLEDFWSTVVAQEGGVWVPISSIYPFDPARDEVTCGGTLLSRAQLEGSAFYCVPDDELAWDDAGLMPALYQEVGDFAMAVVIANQYSAAVQARAGLEAADAMAASLQADCFTGAWAASVFLQDRATAAIRLAPGDLDKALVAFLAFGDAPEDVASGQGDHGTAFQRVAAFRSGLMDGLASCVEEAPAG